MLESAACCQVRFDPTGTRIAPAAGRPELRVAVDLLQGAPFEALLASDSEAVERNGVWLFADAEPAGGLVMGRAGLDLEAATEDLYRRLFAATAGLNLCRVWNYVPQINAVSHGLENYRRFCRARSHAFEKQFGAGYRLHLPAGSAVGSAGGPLAVAFVAARAPVRFFENPRQVPAYEYPVVHGPRPPSFSRASRTESDGAVRVFISGTAAIRGHDSIGAGDLEAQLTATLENLRHIGDACGVRLAAGADPAWIRRFKVYLRERRDLARTADRIGRELQRPGDQVIYLRADICRPELMVEIEATLTRSAAAARAAG